MILWIFIGVLAIALFVVAIFLSLMAPIAYAGCDYIGWSFENK